VVSHQPARRDGQVWPENASARSSNDSCTSRISDDHVKHASRLMDKAVEKPSSESFSNVRTGKARRRCSISCASSVRE